MHGERLAARRSTAAVCGGCRSPCVTQQVVDGAHHGRRAARTAAAASRGKTPCATLALLRLRLLTHAHAAPALTAQRAASCPRSSTITTFLSLTGAKKAAAAAIVPISDVAARHREERLHIRIDLCLKPAAAPSSGKATRSMARPPGEGSTGYGGM